MWKKNVTVQGDGVIADISSPAIALYEVGSIIDESKTNGAKVWKKENLSPPSLFLYVFNNYWHTNYKAYQEGVMEFETVITFKLQPAASGGR